jgi:hypothetical protein
MSSPTAVAAAPECANTTPTTTQWERPGNFQNTTSPSVTNNPYLGLPWWYGGGITIGIGGGSH